MALRLRRGTDAERLLITPLEGELIYTTDTKKVFVGDGSTLGGVPVDTVNEVDFIANLNTASINDLADVNTDSTTPQDGDFLVYNAASGDWRASTLDIDTDAGITEGQQYTIDIQGSVLGADSSVLVDANTNQFIGDLQGSVFADDSTLLIDAVNGEIIGDVNGNVISNNGNTLVNATTEVLSGRGLNFSSPSGVTAIETDTNRIQFLGQNIYGNPNDRSISLETRQETGDPALEILTVAGATQNVAKINFTAFHAARGDLDNPINPASGDVTGGFSVSSYDPLSDTEVPSVLCLFSVDNQETPGNDYVPGKITFSTNGGTGSSPDIKSMSFDSAGRLAVNQTDANDDCALDINGIARLSPQTAPPSTLVEGMIAVADRVTWDPASKGSGGSYPVYYDGTGWNAFY